MEIDIRRAAQEDLDAAEQLYNDVCSALEAGTNWPGWRQGVYPTRTDARRAQAAGALYLAWDGARAIGSMVLNHDADPDYAQVPGWGPDADWPHLLLIHTLAVHPAYQGRGLARRLLAHAEVLARQSGMRALRLDVCVGNVPAIRLYELSRFRLLLLDTKRYRFSRCRAKAAFSGAKGGPAPRAAGAGAGRPVQRAGDERSTGGILPVLYPPRALRAALFAHAPSPLPA